MLGDLCDPPSLIRALDGMEAVCHCAARVEVGGAWSEFEAVTIRGTERLLDAACRQKVKRFLHVSSLGVHGLNGQETITEDSPFDASQGARGHYTRSKIESERLVWQYARERGLPSTVIRPGPLYGPGRPPFVARLRVPLGSKLQIVIARSEQRLPLTYVDHVAEAICLALHSERAIGRAYNIVDGEAIQQGKYLTLLREVGLTKARTILLPPAPFYALASFLERLCRWVGVTPPLSRHQLERALASVVYDTTRVHEELGWSPKVELVEALSTIREARGEGKSV
jgi:nucleoside-diphosphate-sugar epimerase